MNAWAGLDVFCAQSEARAGESSGVRRAASAATFLLTNALVTAQKQKQQIQLRQI